MMTNDEFVSMWKDDLCPILRFWTLQLDRMSIIHILLSKFNYSCWKQAFNTCRP